MIPVAVLPARLAEELGDPHGLHSGLTSPVLVRAAFSGAVGTEILIEEQEAPGVEQWGEPPQRAECRRVDVGVERRECHAPDASGEVDRE